MKYLVWSVVIVLGCVALAALLWHERLHAPTAHVVFEPEEVTILFVGDLFFDRYIRLMSEQSGEDTPFSCVDELLGTADLVVGNLEGPITPYPSISLGSEIGSPSNFVFTFPTTTAALLARHKIGIVNLGNNHIGNFQVEGMNSTRQYLDAAGVHHFGGIAGSEPIYRHDHISFVSYNQFGGQSPEKVAEVVRAESDAGQTVVVYAHWGEEYIDSTAALRPIATLFVTSGADAVIGSHPHVILPSERINNVPVYYSLGNFVFDQYWNEEVRTGLAVSLRFTANGVSATEERVEMSRDGRTCPLTALAKERYNSGTPP